MAMEAMTRVHPVILQKSLEKNYTLKTAKELRRALEKAGATVKLTRSDDTYVSLDDRKLNGDAYISIHNDSLDSLMLMVQLFIGIK